ncbi:MAG TPA: S8 family serine peptidase [Sphingobacteriaceae bacterium]
MKILLSLLFLFTAIYAHGGDGRDSVKRTWKLPAGVRPGDFDPNTVIVKFKRSAATGMQVRGGLTLRSAAVRQQRKIFAGGRPATLNRAEGPEKPGEGLDRVFELRISTNQPVEKIINELLENDQVEYAEPRYIHKVSYLPNDALVGDQTHLARIRALEAWDVVRDASGIVIAIVDSGSDLDHPDLAPNIYLNTADPVNGIDDDGDGYVDNYRGWDFVGRSAGVPAEDNDPDVLSDSTDHGVHVSGLASAAADNAIGVAGVGFNARLMIIKAGADNDGNSIYRGYEGIKYAADHGAAIINCSWGGMGGGAYGQEIINYALSRGCLIIAAAGNENTERPEYPAAYPGVISVGNVRNNDVKNPSSSFGATVDLFAPGSGILSTVNGGRYASYTGTSMSAPLVSGAAALVKTRFPELTMQQVGEQLRATADFIDDLNPGLEGKLGKGRLNVLRAVTEVTPSVRNQRLTVVDKGDGSIPAGDTVLLYFDLKNFLAPAAGLRLTLSASHQAVRILNPEAAVAAIGTLETRQNVGPFRVYIAEGIGDNTGVDFRISYTGNGGSYTDSEMFSLTVSADYINVLVNKVATTFTSNGRIGYSSSDARDGIGFSYKGEELLYEAALMVGNSPVRVSNNARGTNGASDEHFVKQVRAAETADEAGSFDGASGFDDSGNPQGLNLYISHRMLARAAAPDDKYVLVEYELQNKNGFPLTDIFAGLFMDWDVDDDGSDATRFNAVSRLAYTYSRRGGRPYAGVKILSAGSPVYYPLSYQIPGDPLQSGGFTIAEKYQTLSSGVKSTGLGDDRTGYDIQYVLGTGPHTIPANGSVKLAFALIGGEDAEDLKAAGLAAQARYDALVRVPPASASLELKQNYPNPVRGSTTIEFNIPVAGRVNLTLYNILGQRVGDLFDAALEPGVYRVSPDLTGLQNGLYFYRLRFNNEERTLKLQLQRW